MPRNLYTQNRTRLAILCSTRTTEDLIQVLRDSKDLCLAKAEVAAIRAVLKLRGVQTRGRKVVEG
jgi:hypothetical protein